MSILTWLKQASDSVAKSGLIDSESMSFAQGEEQFHGLNMKEALDAHIQWVRRLEGKLSGENHEQLDVATVASDCNCTLGKWLHGPASQAAVR